MSKEGERHTERGKKERIREGGGIFLLIIIMIKFPGVRDIMVSHEVCRSPGRDESRS